jgi:iron complex outermembrane receptor protein
VLRGPQGTLFGAGSQGGTVRFITPAPDLNKVTAYGRAEYGFIDGGGENREIGLAIGAPLVEGKLAFRISGSYRRDGGFIDRVNQFTGAVVEKNANFQESYVVRGALTWAPLDNLKITPSVLYQKGKLNDIYTFWDILSEPANNSYRNGQRLRQPDHDRFVLPALKVEYNGNGFDVFSSTSYFDRRHERTDDYSNLMTGLYAGQNTLASLPNYEAAALMQNRYRAFTQELRVQSQNPAARLTWVLGGFYSHLKQRAQEQILDPQMGDLFARTIGLTVLQETG